MNDEYRSHDKDAFDDTFNTESPEEDVRDEELHNDSFDPDEEFRSENDPSQRTGSSFANRPRNRKKTKKEKIRLTTKKPRSISRRDGFHRAMPYILLGVGVFLTICLILNLFCNYGNKLKADPSAHLMGRVGYGICYALLGLFGPAALILPILIFSLSFLWKRYREAHNLIPKVLDSVALLFLVSILIHTFYLAIFFKDPASRYINGSTLMNYGAAMHGGGFFGGMIAFFLIKILSWVGSFILEFILLFASFFYLLGMTPRYLMMRLRHRRELSARNRATLSEQEAELARKRAEQTAQAKKAQRSDMETTIDGYPAGAVMIYDTNGKPLADDVRDLPPLPNIERTADDKLYLPSGVRRAMREAGEQGKQDSEKKIEQGRAQTERAYQAQIEPKDAYPQATEQQPSLPRSSATPAPEFRDDYRDVDPIFPQANFNSSKRIQKEDRNFDLKNVFIEIDDSMVLPSASKHEPLPPETPPIDGYTSPSDPVPMPAAEPVSQSSQPILPTQPAIEQIADVPKSSVPQESKPYEFPSTDMLKLGPPISAENREQIERNMQQLATTLEDFRVNVKNIDYSCGPTVTRYEITPAAGVHARSIMNLAGDIALAFAVADVRMAQIPGKSAIGVEVPNPKDARHIVYLRNLLESEEFKKSKSKLTVALGADVVNKPVIFDIAEMPHLLVGGATKMGKSVCINCTIMSLLYEAKADEVKLILVDPKKVEFTPYKAIPHLLAPIITSANDAAGALQAAVDEMESRFELIQEVGARTLEGYNELTQDDPDKPFMPYIVIIIDELADLMLQARDQVETSICRLLQKGRASGIHLILGTQRPSVDVVTGLIKSNVPSRIACTVASQVDSRTILDTVGAEKLLGRGDMLYAPVGCMRPERVQGAFVSDKEVETICNFIRAKNGNAVYDEKFTQKMKEFSAQVANKGNRGEEIPISDDAKDDPKYLDAVRLAVEENKVSTSLLQRKIGIGYGRAAKLIDRMQAEGIVSAPDGAKPRSLLITKEEYLERFVDGEFDDSEGE